MLTSDRTEVETAEQRMARARQWVEALIMHSGGDDPIVDRTPNRGWRILFPTDPPMPQELDKEIRMVCVQLFRAYPNDKIFEDLRMAGYTASAA
jgi:hypothetical protein